MQGMNRPTDLDVLVYKTEKPLFIIHLILSLIFWVALVVGTVGIALIYLLVFFIGYLFAQSAHIAWIKGNGVKISAEQFPDLHERYVHCCNVLGVDPGTDAYIINGGGLLNAFATRFLGRNFLVLYSNVVDALSDNPEAINFYIGHELAHIKRKHLQWGPVISPASILPLIGSAYSRAREYTCDQFGHACCNSTEPAMHGLVALAAGEKRWSTLSVPAYLKQTKETGKFWMAFHELIADYPWLVKRAARLDNPNASIPSRNPFSWLIAFFIPRMGVGGGMASMIMMVAIIGVLAAIAIPAYQDYMKRAKQAQGLSLQIPGQPKFSGNPDSKSGEIAQVSPDTQPNNATAPSNNETATTNNETAPSNNEKVFPVPRSVENELVATADAITRQSPKMIDKETRLDGAVAGPGRRITFMYTLPNIVAADVPSGAFDSKFAPNVIHSACTNGKIKLFFDNDVSVVYKYQGKNNGLIGVIEINRAKCGFN